MGGVLDAAFCIRPSINLEGDMGNRAWVRSVVVAILAVVALASGATWGGGWSLFRVATFNIHSGTNANSVNTISAIAAAISSANPDVVALEEVSVKWDTPCGDNIADLRALLPQYPFYFYVPSDTQPADLFKCGWGQNRKTGNAIFSKWPITQSWSLTLPTTWTARNAVAGRVLRGFDQFIVYATQLQNGNTRASDRLNQANTIANDVSARATGSDAARPFFVMGDFNAGSTWAELQPLRNVMNGPQNVIINGDSGIDYGFFRPYNSVSMTLIPSNASDHPGIVILDWWYYTF